MSFGVYSNTDYDALADQLVGETDMDKRLDIYKPVSYTHLDVYKRQCQYFQCY